MGELTRLTLKAARDGLRRKAFSARRAGPGPPRRHGAGAARLNAFITETPRAGARHGRGLRRAPGAGRGRPARRRAARDQGPVLHRGRADHRRLAHPRTASCRPTRSTVTAQAVGGGRGLLGKTNLDEFAMGSSNMTSLLRRRAQSLDARRRQRRPRARRLLRRLGGGGGGAAVPGRDRHRHRRLDPPAGGLLRHRRHQADLRPLLALGHRRLRQLARPGRARWPARSRTAR